MTSRIAVVGSLNMDLVVRSPHLPRRGETVPGGTFATYPGGKGANQAVAAARLGAAVAMVGTVGDDAFGRDLRADLQAEGIDVTHVTTGDRVASGVALITVDAAGDNTIVVASGANLLLRRDDVDAAAEAIAAADVVLVQLEIPLDAVAYAVQMARRHGRRVVLDPAPAPPEGLPAELYREVTVINPNEGEAAVLTGVPVVDEQSAEIAAAHLLGSGCAAVVIKRGGHGAYVATGAMRRMIPGRRVEVVDTTAAGDAFAAALAVGLAEGRDLVDAAEFANAVGALSVTRAGAQPSMPRRGEVEAFMGSGAAPRRPGLRASDRPSVL